MKTAEDTGDAVNKVFKILCVPSALCEIGLFVRKDYP
jgi:hypothetical protein